MRRALLGASGLVESAILNEVLDRWHTVTAAIRHPGKLSKRDRLSADAGDVYDVAELLHVSTSEKSRASKARIRRRFICGHVTLRNFEVSFSLPCWQHLRA
jgi:hypothetical protein